MRANSNRERNILKDSILVIIIVIIGKVFGFARELVVAYLYGSDHITDAFYFSYGMMNSAYLIITMGLAQAFTPTYLDIKIKNGDDRARLFSHKILSILLLLSAIISLIIFFFPQMLIQLLAPEMNEDTKVLCYVMLKILAFTLPVYILFSIRKCILNSNKMYMVTEASGIPYSISIVAFSLILFRITSSNALAIASVLGILLQYLFVFAFSAKFYVYRPTRFKLSDTEVKTYFLLLAPIFLSAIFDEANGLLRKSLASGMGNGAVANLNYCMALTTIINGIIITSISTVFYPQLIRDYSENKNEQYKQNAQKCLTSLLVLVIPLVGFLMITAGETVKAIYERGQFTSNNTIIVAQIFRLYVFGSIMYSVRYVYRTFFYSVKDTRRPVKNEIIFLALTMILNIVQVKIFNMGLVALGYGWLGAMIITTPLLVMDYGKRYFKLFDREVYKEVFKSVASTIAFVVALLVFKSLIHISSVYIYISVSLIISVFVFLLVMYLTKSIYIQMLLKRRKRK